ncbi:hypothetical protein J8N05_42265 [Streptomyces sp. BH-SS-21]|uniref:Uncharacterized protein n=1 Tax=Streptomyces liliiviolaceus TaxID=2823109 RepID=A0A941BID3_9ACTN|nr:hypothetical protein [Streptomyces liliiviolaceus]MBQ0854789.1 hypothetical protein [Streptomyces liliiviolaceus]
MSQPVLALGAALLTAAGHVWYVPALAELRAGTDRPLSRRTAAAACLSGWGTTGTVAAVLLASGTWRMPCAAAVAGTVVTVGLRLCAAVHHRREAREAARHWAQLARYGHRPPVGPGRSRRTLAVLVASGLATALTTVTLLLVTGAADGFSPG